MISSSIKYDNTIDNSKRKEYLNEGNNILVLLYLYYYYTNSYVIEKLITELFIHKGYFYEYLLNIIKNNDFPNHIQFFNKISDIYEKQKSEYKIDEYRKTIKAGNITIKKVIRKY